MARNFYVVLGVSRDADLAQIRQAYRQLVKRYHPDVGASPADRFVEIQEAYETLRDEELRRQHDAMLHTGSAQSVPVRRSSSGGMTRSASPSTPHLYDATDEFFGGYVPGIFTRGRMASRHKDLYVELILDPQEARAGGLYTLTVPVEQACEVCGGSGITDLLTCPACAGRSVAYPEIQLSVPPRVADGTAVRLSLMDVGLDNVSLNVRVSVRESPKVG